MYLDDSYTLRRLQKEVARWADDNFDTSVDYHPLLGLIEETGELAHCVLKAEQGIRGTVEEFDIKAKDAVGDIMIYLCDYASRMGKKIEEVNEELDDYAHTTAHDALIDISRRLGGLSDDYAENDVGAWEINEFTQDLYFFCVTKGWDFREVVWDTWMKVSERDWVANPMTGV